MIRERPGGGGEEQNFKSLVVVLFEEAASFVVMVVSIVGTDCTCTDIHTSMTQLVSPVTIWLFIFYFLIVFRISFASLQFYSCLYVNS